MNIEYKSPNDAQSEPMNHLCRLHRSAHLDVTQDILQDMSDIHHVTHADILQLMDVSPAHIPEFLQDLVGHISPIVATRDWSLIAPLFAVLSVLANKCDGTGPLIQELVSKVMLIYRSLDDVDRIAFLTVLPDIADREDVVEFICQEVQHFDVPWAEHMLLLEYFVELVDSTLFTRQIQDDESIRDFFGQLWERYGDECLECLESDEDIGYAPLRWLMAIYDDVADIFDDN